MAAQMLQANRQCANKHDSIISRNVEITISHTRTHTRGNAFMMQMILLLRSMQTDNHVEITTQQICNFIASHHHRNRYRQTQHCLLYLHM